MRYLLTIALLLTFPMVHLTAQENANDIADSIIQRQDMFEIQERFPKLAPNISSTLLREFLGMQYCINTNRMDSAHIYIDSLLTHHQAEIGFENTVGMVLQKAYLYAQKGEYKNAVDVAQGFLKQVAQFTDTTKLEGFHQLLKIHRPLYDQPVPTLSRSEKDVEVPFIREQVDTKGSLLMRIPVEINGKTHMFALDTGANSTYLHERFARELGLTTIGQVSLGHGMLGSVEAQYAKIDSLVVGDIVFRNPVVYIGPEHAALDSIYYLNAVLGADFLHRIVEMQIDNEKQVVRFPAKESPMPATGPNLIYNARNYYVKLFKDRKPLYFFLDTGDGGSSLNNVYYEAHKREIDATAQIDSAGTFVGNTIAYEPSKKLPDFDFILGDQTVTLKGLAVHTKPGPPPSFPSCCGSLGQQFVKAFRKLTFNFKNGFLSGEVY